MGSAGLVSVLRSASILLSCSLCLLASCSGSFLAESDPFSIPLLPLMSARIAAWDEVDCPSSACVLLSTENLSLSREQSCLWRLARLLDQGLIAGLNHWLSSSCRVCSSFSSRLRPAVISLSNDSPVRCLVSSCDFLLIRGLKVLFSVSWSNSHIRRFSRCSLCLCPQSSSTCSCFWPSAFLFDLLLSRWVLGSKEHSLIPSFRS